MASVPELLMVVATVAARSGAVAAPATSLFIDDGEKFFQVFDALSGEGDDGNVIVDIQDGEAAVLRLHAQRDFVEPLLLFAQHPGDTADGEDVAGRRHAQTARAAGGDRTPFHGNGSCRREAG